MGRIFTRVVTHCNMCPALGARTHEEKTHFVCILFQPSRPIEPCGDNYGKIPINIPEWCPLPKEE